jgi:hypothetical protein
LLLEDESNNKFVFDLKWRRKRSNYYAKLKEGKAIQLELYKELVALIDRPADVITAYFLLSDGKMITVHNKFIQNDNITVVGDNQSIIGKIRNSIEFRRDEMTNGLIEDGEGEKLEELSYVSEPDYDNRIPLEKGSDGKKKKNYYSSFGVFKGNYK